MEKIKIIIKKTICLFDFILAYPVCLIFYPRMIGHCDYVHFDSPGWKRIIRCWYRQKIKGVNKRAIWPASDQMQIGEPTNLIVDETSEGCLMVRGLYLQCMDAKTTIGKRVYIAPNVGIITANHDTADPSKHVPGKNVTIGNDCWIGMNAVILPGIILGDHTVVGAGAVVTKSFPEGYCIIAGNPAKLIRNLDK